MKIERTGLSALILAVGLAGAVQAQQATTDGPPAATFNSWDVYVQESPRQCFARSIATTVKARRDGREVPVRRGEPPTEEFRGQLYVSFYPDLAPPQRGIVSYNAGYTLTADAAPAAKVGERSFAMAAGNNENPSWAWSLDEKQDEELVRAMKAGADAVMTARSSRGTEVSDTFSLRGFTAAFDEADKRCR
ncbi:MAG: invasion associated locus B family protein [Gemmobacter sp.]